MVFKIFRELYSFPFLLQIETKSRLVSLDCSVFTNYFAKNVGAHLEISLINIFFTSRKTLMTKILESCQRWVLKIIEMAFKNGMKSLNNVPIIHRIKFVRHVLVIICYNVGRLWANSRLHLITTRLMIWWSVLEFGLEIFVSMAYAIFGLMKKSYYPKETVINSNRSSFLYSFVNFRRCLFLIFPSCLRSLLLEMNQKKFVFQKIFKAKKNPASNANLHLLFNIRKLFYKKNCLLTW